MVRFERNIFISAHHIPVIQNVKTDFSSRYFLDSLEQKFKENICGRIFEHFILPDIDLFATRQNKQLEQIVST